MYTRLYDIYLNFIICFFISSQVNFCYRFYKKHYKKETRNLFLWVNYLRINEIWN